jgi:hypothetical protein
MNIMMSIKSGQKRFPVAISSVQTFYKDEYENQVFYVQQNVIANDGTIWSRIYSQRANKWEWIQVADLPQPEDNEKQ